MFPQRHTKNLNTAQYHLLTEILPTQRTYENNRTSQGPQVWRVSAGIGTDRVGSVGNLLPRIALL
jgi:hypothetical protein